MRDVAASQSVPLPDSAPTSQIPALQTPPNYSKILNPLKTWPSDTFRPFPATSLDTNLALSHLQTAGRLALNLPNLISSPAGHCLSALNRVWPPERNPVGLLLQQPARPGSVKVRQVLRTRRFIGGWGLVLTETGVWAFYKCAVGAQPLVRKLLWCRSIKCQESQ